jgi:hypothetical protein
VESAGLQAQRDEIATLEAQNLEAEKRMAWFLEEKERIQQENAKHRQEIASQDAQQQLAATGSM